MERGGGTEWKQKQGQKRRKVRNVETRKKEKSKGENGQNSDIIVKCLYLFVNIFNPDYDGLIHGVIE